MISFCFLRGMVSVMFQSRVLLTGKRYSIYTPFFIRRLNIIYFKQLCTRETTRTSNLRFRGALHFHYATQASLHFNYKYRAKLYSFSKKVMLYFFLMLLTKRCICLISSFFFSVTGAASINGG